MTIFLFCVLYILVIAVGYFLEMKALDRHRAVMANMTTPPTDTKPITREESVHEKVLRLYNISMIESPRWKELQSGDSDMMLRSARCLAYDLAEKGLIITTRVDVVFKPADEENNRQSTGFKLWAMDSLGKLTEYGDWIYRGEKEPDYTKWKLCGHHKKPPKFDGMFPDALHGSSDKTVIIQPTETRPSSHVEQFHNNQLVIESNGEMVPAEWIGGKLQAKRSTPKPEQVREALEKERLFGVPVTIAIPEPTEEPEKLPFTQPFE